MPKILFGANNPFSGPDITSREFEELAASYREAFNSPSRAKDFVTRTTAEEIRSLVSGSERRVHHHDCCLCGYPCAYLFTRYGDVWYDSGCDCTGRYRSSQKSHQDVADWVNMQTSDAMAEEIMKSIRGES